MDHPDIQPAPMPPLAEDNLGQLPELKEIAPPNSGGPHNPPEPA